MSAYRLMLRSVAAVLVALPALSACTNPFPRTVPAAPPPTQSDIPVQERTARVSLPVGATTAQATEGLAPAVTRLGGARTTHAVVQPHGKPLDAATLRSTAEALVALGVQAANVTTAPPAEGPDGKFDVALSRVVAGQPDCDAMVRPSDTTFAQQRAGFAFGCATLNNLSRQVDDPKDLVHPQNYDGAAGTTSVNAVRRYDADKTYPVEKSTSFTPGNASTH